MTIDRSFPPQIKDFGDLKIPSPRYITLDNGVPLIVVDNGSQEINRLSIIWTGGLCETSHATIANLALNLLREGTNKHNGAHIAEKLEYNGAWLKSQMHSHHSSLVSYSLNDKVSEIYPILVEIMSSPIYPTREFEVLREKLIRTATLDREKVEFYSAMEMRRLIMGESHPLAKSDSPEEIASLTVDDLFRFKHKILTRPHALYLTGRITPSLEDIVNDNFATIKSDVPTCEMRVDDFKPSSTKLVKIKRDGAMQSAIRMSIPTINRSYDDYVPLRLAVMALGGYFGSRLMTNIREEKGYTYGITASLLGYREGGIISIGTQCDNRYVEPLIEEVIKEIERMKTGNFDYDEMQRLKNYAMTQLISVLDSPFSIMDYYENICLSDTPVDYFYQQLHEIKMLSAEKLASIATKYFNIENLYTTISGDM